MSLIYRINDKEEREDR